jgi:hypothetical protein
MVPGNVAGILPDVGLDEALGMPAEEYCARVLARVCDAASRNAKGKDALLINYDQLPGAVTTSILRHLGVAYTADEIAQMEAAASFNAKTPQMFFEPDADRKRTEATEAVRTAAAKWVDPIYHQLESLRLESER